MIALLLLAQLALPQVLKSKSGDIREVFSAYDMPRRLMAAGERAFVVYSRTTVNPDGQIKGCIVELSSGERELDELTCSIITRRAKFAPAKWTDGSPVHGVIRLPIQWIVSEYSFMPRRLSVADLDVFVDRLPKGVRAPARISLIVSADDSGKILDCRAYPRPSHLLIDPEHPMLVPLACRQAMAGVRAAPPRDDTGKPVRSVQTVLVDFKIKR